MISKTMYNVEKFLPPSCPKCRHYFADATEDYTLLLGDIVDGKKVVRETTGYDIIICNYCGNYTARVTLETYCVGDKTFAEKLVAEQGFVNLMKVTSVGNCTEDHHAVMGVNSGLQVRDAMKGTPLHEVADALERARAKFHGLAAAVFGHLDGGNKIDLGKIANLSARGE